MTEETTGHGEACPAREDGLAECACPPEDQRTTYVVVGPQAVHGTEPGGVLVLDPTDPQTGRLQSAGHVVPVDTTEEGN